MRGNSCRSKFAWKRKNPKQVDKQAGKYKPLPPTRQRREKAKPESSGKGGG
jgi:hypothetical protein